MKKKISIFFLLASLIIANAQPQIHAVGLLDTDMPSADEYKSEILYGAKNVRENLEYEALFLAKNFNIPETSILKYEVSGQRGHGNNNFDSTGLKTVLEKLNSQIRPGDYVFIFSYTHGMRNLKTSAVSPNIIIGDFPISYNSILESIIKTSKPKVVFSVVTACQARSSRPNGRVVLNTDKTVKYDIVASSGNRDGSKVQYQSLFANPSWEGYETTSIELYSCSAFEFTYIDAHGGPFFSELMNEMGDKLSLGGETRLSWETIMSPVITEVKLGTQIRSYGQQNPFGLIRHFKNNAEVSSKMIRDNGITENTAEPLVKTQQYFEYEEYTINGKKPTLRVTFKLAKLSLSYIASNAPEQAVRTSDCIIRRLKESDDSNLKKKINTKESRDIAYYLASAYEAKGRGLKALKFEKEAIEFLKMAAQIYKRKEIDAKGSSDIMESEIKALQDKVNEMEKLIINGYRA